MKPLYSKKDFNKAKGMVKLPLMCYTCSKTFFRRRGEIISLLNGNPKNSLQFCSQACKFKARVKKKKMECKNCQIVVERVPSAILNNVFCSHACSATYNNKHKKYGFRRSKIEFFMEKKLRETFQTLEIVFNDKTAIGSELDVFIPILNLAFEFNGIFHYIPIYGIEKLEKIQNNDAEKQKECKKLNISLFQVDISSIKHFKESKCLVFWEYVEKIINSSLTHRTCGIMVVLKISNLAMRVQFLPRACPVAKRKGIGLLNRLS